MPGPGINSYSTTPANNVQANTSIDWDEGMSPGLVNNSARQNMADTRAAFNDLIWFQYGAGDEFVACVYASSTSFTIAGVDVTSVYHAGRRVRAVGSSTGTIYGTISSSSFSTNTTVNMTWDAGATLSNETLTISLSQIPITGNPLLQITQTQNALSAFTFLNANGSTGASANYIVNNGTSIGRLAQIGTGNTSGSSSVQDSTLVSGGGAGGIGIATTVNQPIIFYINNSKVGYFGVNGGGVVLGAATGGDEGLGTLNVAGGVYKNGTAYTNPDYVFEHWATGKIEKFADKEGAKEYTGLKPISEVREIAREKFALPGFGQDAKNDIFSGSDQLLARVEELYLYIFDLHDRIAALEAAR